MVCEPIEPFGSTAWRLAKGLNQRGDKIEQAGWLIHWGIAPVSPDPSPFSIWIEDLDPEGRRQRIRWTSTPHPRQITIDRDHLPGLVQKWLTDLSVAFDEGDEELLEHLLSGNVFYKPYIDRLLNIANTFASQCEFRDTVEAQTFNPAQGPQGYRFNILLRFLQRVCSLQCLVARGWFSYQGQSQYFRALAADAKAHPDSPSLFDRFNAVLKYTLTAPEDRVQDATSPWIGEVPYLGRIGHAEYEQPLTPRDFSYFFTPTDEFLEAVFGPGGLVQDFPFCQDHFDAFYSEVAVHANIAYRTTIRAWQGRFGGVHVGSRRRAFGRLYELFGEVDLQRGTGNWREIVAMNQVVDTDNNFGDYATSVLHELLRFIRHWLDQEGSNEDLTDLILRLVNSQITVVVDNEGAVYVTRQRIADAALAWMPAPDRAHEINLTHSVRMGRAIQEDYARFQANWKPSERVVFRAHFPPLNLRDAMRSESAHRLLRDLAGMLNSDGGTILVGVRPDGSITEIPLDPDAETFGFERSMLLLMTQLISQMLNPNPMHSINLVWQYQERNPIMLISVQSSPTLTYLHPQAGRDEGAHEDLLCARRGMETITLHDRERDDFLIAWKLKRTGQTSEDSESE